MTSEMDPDHRVPLLRRHVGERPIPEDPGIVDEHVEVAKGLHRQLNQLPRLLPIGDVVVTVDGPTSTRLDLPCDLPGRGAVRAGPVYVPAEVIDHHPGPFRGEEQRVGAAKASAGAGHNGDPAIKSTHGSPFQRRSCWAAGRQGGRASTIVGHRADGKSRSCLRCSPLPENSPPVAGRRT